MTTEPDAAAIERILDRLRADPRDPIALQEAKGFLGRRPQTDPRGDPALSTLHLLIRLTGRDITDQDLDALRSSVLLMAERHKEILLGALLNAENGDRNLVVFLLERLKSLSGTLPRELAAWLEKTEPIKKVRDAVQRLICLKCGDDGLVRETAGYEGGYRLDAGGAERDIMPRRLTADIAADDPFMKLVEPGSAAKTGGMKILIIADFNIAGQLTALMRALNKYTNHAARCVILQDDYLSYDKDVIITDGKGNADRAAAEEACRLVRKADFFHVGRRLFNLPGIDWNKHLSPSNAVFQYFGSHLRDNGPAIAEFHAKSGFKAITNLDWTVYRNLPQGFYHVQPYMIETGDMPMAGMDFSGKLRICHAPSNSRYRKLKRTDLILDVMDQVVAEDARAEKVLIEGLPNRQCLELKSTCHLHVVALRYGPGLNTVESAAMGLLPLAQMPNFVRFVLPDCPVVNITARTLYQTLKGLLADPERILDLSRQCRQWVKRNFEAENLVRTYWYLYDFIYNGFSVDYPEIPGRKTPGP